MKSTREKQRAKGLFGLAISEGSSPWLSYSVAMPCGEVGVCGGETCCLPCHSQEEESFGKAPGQDTAYTAPIRPLRPQFCHFPTVMCEPFGATSHKQIITSLEKG